MMLTQKQPHFSLSPPHFALQHRRHPSAPPAVLVQPTRTPGLLSLSKPQQRSQPQQPRPKPSPRPKQATPARSPKPASAVAATPLKPSADISDKKLPATPERRGRQPAKAPDSRPARSVSNSSVRGRRHNTRQPSPPLSQSPSQAEVPSTPPRKQQDESFRIAPKLTSSPSGKLARRRQPQPSKSLTTPAPSARAIPFQRANSIPPTLSQSVPAKPKLDTTQWKFPICDDFNEDEAPMPSTPTRPRPQRFTDNGPQTAPLSTSLVGFPFNVALPASPSPSQRKKARKHVRTPSEGVFQMSDEDLSASSSDEATIRRKTISLMKAGKLTQAEMEAAVAAGYFASSTFQNSPSPEDLPPPIFV